MPRPTSLPSLLALLLISAAAPAFAQAPPLPRPGLAPQSAPGLPGGGSATVPNLEFPGSDVKEVLAFYEKLTGKRLLIDNTVAGPINISVKQEISVDEARSIIEISLLMNGFSLVPGEGNIVKVAGIGKNPRSLGVPIISDELSLPEGEQVVTFLHKLRYADPTEVSQALANYIPPAQGQYTQLLALPNSQALVITENTAIIRRILPLLYEVDVPPAKVESEFITLERADAKDVLEKLTAIFEQAQPGQTPGSVPRPSAGGKPRNLPPTTPDGTQLPGEAVVSSPAPNTIEITSSLSEDSIIVGKIKLTADTRTNRIHVVTRPVNLPFVRQLISEFDRDVPFGNPVTRPLKFVSAGDILQTVVQAISDPGEEGQTGTGGTAGSTTRPSTGTGRGGSSQGNDLFGGGNRNGSFGGSGSLGSGSGSGSGGMSLSESLNTEERDVVPEAVVVGTSGKIIADKRANAIIVLGNQEIKNKVFALLDKLDVRAPQVMLHTVIGELNLTKNERYGVNYILRNGSGTGLVVPPGTGTGGDGGTGGGDGTGTGSAASGGAISITNGAPVLNLNNLLGGQDITQIVTGGATGLSGFVTAGNAFNAFIDLLESTNRFRVVSRPSIFTSNNKRATIASGEEIAIPSVIQSGFTGGTTANNLVTQSSIQYKTVALQLEVLPLINSENEVSLDIVQKVNEQSGFDVIDNNRIPRIATRVLQTNVMVPNNGTLVLGGLIKQTNSKTTSGIPVLSRIPVLGALFRTTSNDKTRTELVIMIRPVVTNTPCDDTDTREREMEFFNIEPDLESTVYPANSRKRVPAEQMLRDGSMMLRADEVCEPALPVKTKRASK